MTDQITRFEERGAREDHARDRVDPPDPAPETTARAPDAPPADAPPPGAGEGRRREVPEPQHPEPAAPPADTPAAEAPPSHEGTGEPAAQPAADPRARTRRRRLLLFLGLSVVLLAAAFAAYYFLYAVHYASTDDAFIDGKIVRVSAETSGVLFDVSVTENQRVEPGTVLARIDPRQANAQRDVAAAQLSQSRAALKVADAQVGEAQATLDARRSAQNAAEVAAKNTSDTADRYESLAHRSGNLAISQQDIEDARSTADQAAADLAEAKGATAEAEAAVVGATAQQEQAAAEVKAAEAQLADAEVTVDFLSVQSRIAGHVAQVAVNDGSYVAPGDQLMAIVPDDLYVTANFKETQLEGIEPGAPVDIRIDAFPDVDFKGHVDSIQHGAGQAFAILPAQNATGNFVKVVQRVPVKIVIDSPSIADYPVGPGMSVVPTVHLGS
ncbi:HlyD family secretion protein [Acuticoccus sediminis]|uniref:HlyD family secretion protein n=1 Tax=Acuticoccus sediminis TaxID=2184697 RepID=UPI001CFE07BC|nr:HlyD family secretion protein [Acuticoccus sediminis]